MSVTHMNAIKFIRHVELDFNEKTGFGFDVQAGKVPAGSSANIKPPHVIHSVAFKTPADLAGLLPGDVILQVGIVKASGLALSDVQSLIANERGMLSLTIESSALEHMKHKTKMIKVRSSLYHRDYTLSEDYTRIYWHSKSKKSHVALYRIGDIKEIRLGRNTQSFKRSYDSGKESHKHTLGGDAQVGCLSIIYGESFECVDLVVPGRDHYVAWSLGLQFLANRAGTKMKPSVGDQQTVRDAWLREIFDQSDINKDQELSLSEIQGMLKMLNINLPQSTLKRKFYEADMDKAGDAGYNKLSFEEFKMFYKSLSTRVDIGALMVKYGSGELDRSLPLPDDSYDDLTISADQLQTFYLSEQSQHYSMEQCSKLIDEYEFTKKRKEEHRLGVDGFVRLLTSADNELANPAHSMIYQDMDQPLAHYFVASSHNTYLTDDQLRGPSDPEAYKRALMRGCRCVEIDCWDGDSEPIVYHGHTLTSKILFRDVITAINEYAFYASDYPVIVSLENHCSIPQQQMMANFMVNIFGDKLYTFFDETLTALPSPNALKNKILVKGKKLKAEPAASSSTPTDDAGEVTDEDEAEESLEDAGALKSQPKALKKQLQKEVKDKKKKDKGDKHAHKIKLAKELSALVNYIKSAGFKGFDDTKFDTATFYEINSIVEGKARNFSTSPEYSRSFVLKNTRQLVRIYPAGFRVNSSNYDPTEMWNTGCQLVALNYQTPSLEMNLNLAKFRDNGGSGYLLKPAGLRDPRLNFDPCNPGTIDPRASRVLTIRVISGQTLPKPNRETKGEIVDPYVYVQVFGIPCDNASARTHTIDNNGFNPIWNDTLEFDVRCPELALVCFSVYDYDTASGDDFLAQYCLPFHSLRPGYRHIKLRTMADAPMSAGSLFVHVSITSQGRSDARRQSTVVRSGTNTATMSEGKQFRDVGQSIDAIMQAAPTEQAMKLREAVLQSTEDFISACGMNFGTPFTRALAAAKGYFIQYGITTNLEKTTRGGVVVYNLHIQSNDDGMAQRTADKYAKAFSSLRNATEAIVDQRGEVISALRSAIGKLEELLKEGPFNAFCDENKIAAAKRPKAKEGISKRLLFLNEWTAYFEGAYAQAIDNMAQISQVFSVPSPQKALKDPQGGDNDA